MYHCLDYFKNRIKIRNDYKCSAIEEQFNRLHHIHVIGIQEFARWLSGKESACQHRGHSLNSSSGKIPNSAEQLGPRTTTIEPVL